MYWNNIYHFSSVPGSEKSTKPSGDTQSSLRNFRKNLKYVKNKATLSTLDMVRPTDMINKLKEDIASQKTVTPNSFKKISCSSAMTGNVATINNTFHLDKQVYRGHKRVGTVGQKGDIDFPLKNKESIDNDEQPLSSVQPIAYLRRVIKPTNLQNSSRNTIIKTEPLIQSPVEVSAISEDDEDSSDDQVVSIKLQLV